TMQIDGSGITITDVTRNLISASADIKLDHGIVYSTTGAFVDPQNRKVLGRFALPPDLNVSSVVPDPITGLTFFLSVNRNTPTVLAFNQNTRAQVGTMTIAVDTGVNTPGSLIRWGANGLAFRTSGNQVVIFQIPSSWAPGSM